MGDIISDMNSQIKFLTPAIAGIVVGITSMVTSIIGKLGTQLKAITESGPSAQAGLIGLFGDGIATYYFQIIVGIYVVQITYILTVLVNGIENGSDTLREKYQLGINLVRSTILYCIIAGAVIIAFNVIAANILVDAF